MRYDYGTIMSFTGGGHMIEQDKIFQLALAIIPGMMARYTKEEKSEPQVIADSFLLAQEFCGEIYKAGTEPEKGM